MLARCFFDCVNIVAFSTAVIHMHMAELYAILLTSPFLMTVLAALFLREPIGYRRWLATGVGFLGMLLVVKPNMNAIDEWALIGLLSALAAAIRETATQRIDPGTPTIEVTFYSAIFAGAAPLVSGWHESWPAITQQQYMMVVVQASNWFVGAFLLIQACRLAPLSIIASCRYTLLIWGSLAGYIVLGEIPDRLNLMGAGLILSCALYTFHREAARRRTIASDVVTLN